MRESLRQVRLAISTELSAHADSSFAEADFYRRGNRLRYWRQRRDCIQMIKVHLYQIPENNQMVAYIINPFLAICIPSVNATARLMTNSDNTLLPLCASTLRQPIGCVWSDAEPGRWHLHEQESVTSAIASFANYSRRFVIPFLHEYSSADAMIRFHELNDKRILSDRSHLLRIVAAYLTVERPAHALDLLQRHFGRPMMRRVYAPVYRYVEQRLAEAEQRDAKS